MERVGLQRAHCKDQVWRNRNNCTYWDIPALNLIDKPIAVHSKFVMRQEWQSTRRIIRPFVAALVACLLFQQALALVFSHARHSGDFGAFISSPVALSSDFCAEKRSADDKAPHVQHMHCLACVLSEQSSHLELNVVLAAVVLVLTPRSDAPPHFWMEQRDLAPPTAQWPSNRLSRAPPSLLS